MPLHQNCERASKCWQSIPEDRYPKSESHCNRITLPWVGGDYRTSRVLVIGENFYEMGGLNACTDLVNDAMNLMIRDNKKRIFGGGKTSTGKTYGGTFFYYRMAHYSGALVRFLETGNSIPDFSEFTEPNRIARYFDNIAYTNHIKCSPLGNRSRMSAEMWSQCGKHILSEEIEILEPKWIIVLGKANNAYYLKQFVSNLGRRCDGAVSGFVGEIRKKSVNILVVPHPSYFRYKVAEVATALVDAASAVALVSGS